MKKKFLGLALAAMLSISQMASAQQVVVEGNGIDKASAMKDASRNAVERVVGTLVDSTTLVGNGMVQLDQIYTKSQGFVTDIQVLSQGNNNGVYHIQARVDVNTDPNAQLMNNLKMIMMLNDPRIAVVVLKQDPNGNMIGHDTITESAMNDKLLGLGFGHVVDAQIVGSLQNAQLLNNIYNGQTGISAIGQSLGADYLVIGRVNTESHDISLPDGNGGYKPTLLKSGDATLTVKVIRFDTGDIVGTFTSTAKGVENTNTQAEKQALIHVSEDAAKKLEQKFRHFSANSNANVQLEIYTESNSAVNRLVEELKALSGVQNVYLREQQGQKSMLTVDTSLSSQNLLQMLQSQTKLGIFVGGITGSTLKLGISD